MGIQRNTILFLASLTLTMSVCTCDTTDACNALETLVCSNQQQLLAQLQSSVLQLQSTVVQMQAGKERGASQGSHIVQCTWNHSSMGAAKSLSSGLVKSCYITKKSSKSALRVKWSGDVRLFHTSSSGYACKRWYFTFNGAECSSPDAIDIVVHTKLGEPTENFHKTTSVEGLCFNVPAGELTVGFNIGKCKVGNYPEGNALTGHFGVSRIIVEEVTVI
ncbi:collagen triple helix repeat-containing protein 1-like [Lingula anatina]|uniref:Collagen triple helix repeat-containing protein 1-like n=1 Tax=Lingula anatina TaxID=7574 RepID=A0A1S3IN16_LINAN|nr:collagen triple helix repeat-containing protein 1-like [Lingula anatina]|eukprot:XP_013399630.1 collagen triple helix repeat-containing protein 1-like [Lingula anatina]